MSTSYNGWPASPDPAAIGVDRAFSVCGSAPFEDGGYAGGILAGPVADVFTHLITRLHHDVEPMMIGDGGEIGYGCWGYSYRDNVNNPGQLSCHASATAIDYNAPLHPNGTSTGPGGGGGWTGDQYAAVLAILDECGGVISWLTGNDPMHFEICGTAADVAAAAATLPTSERDWFDMATEDELRAIVADEVGKAVAALPAAVWGHPIHSLVSDSDGPAGSLLAYTNQAVEAPMIGQKVWDHPLASLVSGADAPAGSLLQYTNLHTDPSAQ